MRTPHRADPIYPLTLTELAFIVIFLILLLTGWMVVKTQDEREAAVRRKEEALARLDALSEPKALERLEAREASLRRAEQDLRRLLAGQGNADPEALVSALVNQAGAEAEHQRLQQRVEDLDAQLSALAEIRKLVEEAVTGGPSGDVAGSDRSGRESAALELRSALEFKRSVEKETGEPLGLGREREQAVRYASALRAAQAGTGDAAGIEQLVRDNRDLRARAAWLRGQLEARGGRDYPPCWAEETSGKPQYLFTIELRDGGLRVEPAWPPERGAEAERTPGVAALVGAGSLSVPAFRARVQPLDEDSKAKHCRHYVRLANRVQSLATFNRLRYAVEEFFYKFEIR
jgi:hypothetical protein